MIEKIKNKLTRKIRRSEILSDMFLVFAAIFMFLAALTYTLAMIPEMLICLVSMLVSSVVFKYFDYKCKAYWRSLRHLKTQKMRKTYAKTLYLHRVA